ncbi:cysteine synthase [Salpingoeca rosetta]|uniref:Cysteine synthase n=1 Tax=Salpingoeca rosetta (strain ATCC 50818 / BSB-021) TaxID=946362 RepID=F2TXD4_SALR5|nr:cysteine synthase [Salpingoeca rosetta]EGD76043.1 cysteine synthase [Salpingoeca rosetta]|eukprot:XP_004998218.1 cysteine synthase [Salpingoeca rosetta]
MLRTLAVLGGGCGVGAAGTYLWLEKHATNKQDGGAAKGSDSAGDAVPTRGDGIAHGVIEAIGNTPLIELPTLSKATGCRILVKAESLNPGGSVKDRPARQLLLEAERRGQLKRNGECIVEGTGGNTGVGLAMLASALGYEAKFAMPAAISPDKVRLMRLFGAETILQPGVPFSDERHFYHVTSRLSKLPNHFGPDQFENTDNAMAHYHGTGAEIWRQTRGKVDAFTCAAGTGGTIAGCSMYLKEKNPNVKVVLLDPPGSGLGSYLKKVDTHEAWPGHTVVTVLCDTGDRYLSTLYNEKWLEEKKLTPLEKDVKDQTLSFIATE